MDKPLLSRKHWIYLGMAAILLIAAGAYLGACPDANAAEKDADFYKRTGTEKPYADYYLGPLLNISDQADLGIAFTVAPRDIPHPFLFTLEVSKMRINGATGEAPFAVGCHDFLVPYSVPGRNALRGSIAFQFKLP